MRKNIYKWHRTLSLIIALPVVLWAASGFMHPIMTNIRPKVGTQWLRPQLIDTSKIKITLAEVLVKNNIATIHNFRIVKMGGNWFYQIQLPGHNVLQYISTQTGMLLKNGDELYARHLAKQFLQGDNNMEDPDTKPSSSLNGSLVITGLSGNSEKEEPEVPDCCLNTTVAIMNDKSGAEITTVSLVQNFTDEYKSINRLLPAYKVSFDRADGIRIYVETAQDRFAFAMDNKRAVFDKIFSLFHTMSWLEFMGKGKLVIEMFIILTAFLTTIMGIYIFFTTKTKKPKGNEVVKARRNHRWTSILVSLFTLFFTFSGAFHAFQKFTPDTRDLFLTKNEFSAGDLSLNMAKLQSVTGTEKSITNVSLVKINGKTYWQVFNKKEDAKDLVTLQSTDLMKRRLLPAPVILYASAGDYTLLKDGEKKYAGYLATLFSNHQPGDIIKTEQITQFEDEYGFVNKRLPVWKISYTSNSHERFYVETSTGKLAARVSDKDLPEGYSFSLFHKHHFMDFGGKGLRDFSTMFWAAAQIAMVTVGFLLYFKMKKKRKAEIL